MKRKYLPITLVSLLLGGLFDLLFYGKIPGVSVFLYTAAILGLTFYLARRFKAALPKTVLLLAPAALLFAAFVFIRASPLLIFLNSVMVLYLLLLIVAQLFEPKRRLSEYRAADYAARFIGMPLHILGAGGEFVRQWLQEREAAATDRQNAYKPVLRGILLSVPVLLVFLLLFSSADLVFQRYVGSLFEFDVSPELIVRLGLAGFIALLFAGAYALMFMRARTGPEQSANVRRFSLGPIETFMVLGSVAGLFLVFVLIQLAYFFGGPQHIASTGITYAEYARRGFFELIMVAVISLGLLLALNKFAHRRNARQNLDFKLLSGTLMLEVLVIMASSYRRLSLYEEAYGFTVLRLFSHMFIGWLAGVFILLALHIIGNRREQWFAQQAFLSMLVFLAILNLINPDAVIARSNIERFNKTGKLDTDFLATLSEDALPVTKQLLGHENDDLRGDFARSLYYRQNDVRQRGEHWQSYNYASDRALDIYEQNEALLEASKSRPFGNPESYR